MPVPVADQFAVGDPLRDGGVVHADDDDAVIGEQFAFDGFAERQGIQHFAKQGGVVHADDFDAAIFGGFMDGAGVGARGGGGEQPLGAAYLRVVEDGGEVAADLARATVGFVRHGQIERGDGWIGLGGGDDGGRLVGGENHAVACAAEKTSLLRRHPR